MESALLPLISFIITFSFTLGVMYITSYIFAFFFYKEHLPPMKIILMHNAFSAFLIALSFTTFIHIAPSVYNKMKLNNGLIQLSAYEGKWKENLHIEATSEKVKFNLCGKIIDSDNNMKSFYDNLTKNLEFCPLERGIEVSINIINNPFKEIMDKSTNSILVKYIK